MSYIDTSVLVAVYCPEALSRSAERVVRGDRAPAISMLTEVEFCSALSLKTRTGEMDASAAERVLSLFRAHVKDGVYDVVPIRAAECEQAADWIATFSTTLRTLDALHLAAAHSRNLVLITADKSLVRAAAHLGVKSRSLA